MDLMFWNCLHPFCLFSFAGNTEVFFLRRTAVKTDRKLPLNSRLHDARVEHGWSQQELAERIGTTVVNISRWENGATFPSPYFRQRLCEVFGKTPVELGLLPPSSQASRIVNLP